MIKYEDNDYESMRLGPEDNVPHSYITYIQNNHFHQVTITREQCKKSVRVLSRLGKKKENNE